MVLLLQHDASAVELPLANFNLAHAADTLCALILLLLHLRVVFFIFLRHVAHRRSVLVEGLLVGAWQHEESLGPVAEKRRLIRLAALLALVL